MSSFVTHTMFKSRISAIVTSDVKKQNAIKRKGKSTTGIEIEFQP
jgi:hypothetical protein